MTDLEQGPEVPIPRQHVRGDGREPSEDALSKGLVAEYQAAADAAARKAVMDRLYRLHKDAVRRMVAATYKTKDENVVDDLVQEVWLALLEKLGEYVPDEKATFLGWVGRIAANLCMDRLRDQRRRKKLRPEPRELPDPGLLDPEELPLFKADFARAIEDLPAVEAEVFLMVHERGLTYSMMVAETGAPERTLRRHLERAREKLAEMLARWNPAASEEQES
jgi:RNA polymerase sigma-70 factor, ECF subfamily